MYTFGYLVGMAGIIVLGVWGWAVLAIWPRPHRMMLLTSWVVLFIVTLALLLSGE